MKPKITLRVLSILALPLCASCVIPGGTDSERSAIEQRNLDVAQQYEDFYNTDIEQFVQIYTEDCIINGRINQGRDELLQNERAYLASAPRRTMRIGQKYAVGDVVIVLGVILDPDREPDWNVPFCAVLTFHDGKIALDWTYAEFSKFQRGE